MVIIIIHFIFYGINICLLNQNHVHFIVSDEYKKNVKRCFTEKQEVRAELMNGDRKGRGK